MRKWLSILILIICSSTFVGCGKQNKELFMELKISYVSQASSTRLAIGEIEDRITGLIIVDYKSLTEDKMLELCEVILTKWHVENIVKVCITELNTIKITIGEAEKYETRNKKIMVTIDNME